MKRQGVRFALLAVLALGGCGTVGGWFGEDEPKEDGPAAFRQSQTRVAYSPTLEGAPSPEMAGLMEESLALWRRQPDGAPSLALLRRRAEGDVETARKILRSGGYFNSRIDIDLPPVSAENAADVGQPVTLSITPGRRFTLAAHRFEPTRPGEDVAALAGAPREFGSPVGEAATAATILGAESGAVAALRASGRPWAQAHGRKAVADLETATLDIISYLDPGPAATFGPLNFEGLTDVEERYLRTYLPWAEGAPASVPELAEFQRRLFATDLFTAVSVNLPEQPPDSSGAGPVSAPVTLRAEMRKPRTVSAGLRYDTDVGPSVRFGLEHRNLFGANEQGSAVLEAGLIEQRITFAFRKPQFGRPDQDLTAGLALRRLEDEAYDELGATATVGVERKLNDLWTVGAGGLAEVARITDDGETTNSRLVGIPAFVRYDSTTDLLDPITGLRAAVRATPFAGQVDGDFRTFLVLDTEASAYIPVHKERGAAIAIRGRVGSIVFSELDDVPANRRLYAGGGGSVRGYAQRFIGQLDDQGDPVGGRSVVEAGAELRGRVYGDFGGAVFVEAGSVSDSAAPDFNEGVQTAAGIGFRYYSALGPIRADIAAPLNPRDADDRFQLYFSIGQAF